MTDTYVSPAKFPDRPNDPPPVQIEFAVLTAPKAEHFRHLRRMPASRLYQSERGYTSTSLSPKQEVYTFRAKSDHIHGLGVLDKSTQICNLPLFAG